MDDNENEPNHTTTTSRVPRNPTNPLPPLDVATWSLHHCLFGEEQQSKQIMAQQKQASQRIISTARNSSQQQKISQKNYSHEEQQEKTATTDLPLKGKSNDNNDAEDEDDLSSVSSIEEVAPLDGKWASVAKMEADERRNQKQSLRIAPPHVVHMKQLRKIVAAGGIHENDDDDAVINEDHHHHYNDRGVAWRVLIGYLSCQTEQWHTELLEKRTLYIQLAAEAFRDTSDVVEFAMELRGKRRSRPRPTSNTINNDDGTTNQNNNSETPIHPRIQKYWKDNALDPNVLDRLTKDRNALQIQDVEQKLNQFIIDQQQDDPERENNEHKIVDDILQDFVESALLLDEIRKDVVRTHPELAFFLEPTRHLGKRRYAAIERILFLWSKHHKGIRYVQGMNEIVGILYFVLANDPNEEWATWAEADAYWLFHILLAEMSDVFVPGLDAHSTGIHGRIKEMNILLERHDPEVKEHFSEIGIELNFFAVRWWTTLLSREFLLPDTVRLWDSMFASTHKDNFLRYVCINMLIQIREKLLKGDFSTCLKLLQKYPPTNIDQLLESSRALWIYETQVSVACHRGGLSLHQALTAIQSPPALVYAFGFPNGTPPVSRAEQLERAKEKAGATVINIFGRAKGLYNKYYAGDIKQHHRSSSVDMVRNVNHGKTHDDLDQSDVKSCPSLSHDESDDIYLKAILKQS
jgi:hypothetical protein